MLLWYNKVTPILPTIIVKASMGNESAPIIPSMTRIGAMLGIMLRSPIRKRPINNIINKVIQ